MSCRVFVRQLEFEIMNVVVDIAQQRGIKVVRALYIPTKKNAVIDGLYEKLGFTRLDGCDAPPGATCWVLSLADYVRRDTFISRSESLTS